MGSPGGEGVKYIPKEERGKTELAEYVSVCVRQSQSTDDRPWGREEGMIVYLQEDREELCLLTYSPPGWSKLLHSLRGPISSSS